MSKHNEHSIKDAIDKLLKVYKLDQKFAERKLIDTWKLVMGEMIAKHTTSLYISNKVLYITLDSSALRHELSLSKTKIIEHLNANSDRKVITDIVFY